MTDLKGENFSRDTGSLVRAGEIEAYLDKPDYQRTASELPDISTDERRFLAQSAGELYLMAKAEAEEVKRLGLVARFNDTLALIVCDPGERKMAFGPPSAIEYTVFRSQNDCLVFGTGTIGERIYFETNPLQWKGEQHEGRCMRYPYPSDSATEMGRKFYRRFCEAFGANLVNLDTGSASWW